jgi:hypothetical protein
VRFFVRHKLIKTLTCIKSLGGFMCENSGMKTTVESIVPDAFASAARETVAVGSASTRMAREWRTMRAMVRCYCRGHQKSCSALCGECRELLSYAGKRLERCQFGEDKPTCAKCPVHCYQRQWREQIKTVMRYAGPRMIWRHPVLSLRHWLDSFRNGPVESASETSTSLAESMKAVVRTGSSTSCNRLP